MNRQTSTLAAAVAVALGLPFAAPALAQSANSATPSTLDTVIVTGTHVSDRTVAESQSPIEIGRAHV